MKAHVYAFLLFTVGLLAAQAQVRTAPPIDIAVVEVSPAPNGNTYARLSLTNKGTQPIVGYVVVVDCEDTAGKLLGTFTGTRMVGLEAPLTRSSYAAGEVWQDRIALMPACKSPKSRLDAVLFTGGGKWGEDSRGQLAKLLGIQEGWRMAVVRMKRELGERGAQGLADYLGRLP